MSSMIIGGAGFIGSNIVKYIYENTNEDIYILDNLSTGYYKNIEPYLDKATFYFEDIEKINSKNFIDNLKPDRIFLTASRVSVQESISNPKSYFKTNILGTINVLDAALAIGSKVVFSSSSSVYGNCDTYPVTETQKKSPISPYGMTKDHAEDIILYYSKMGLDATILRYFNVYGPNQSNSSEYSGVISKFAKLKAEEKTPTVYGDGEQTRDFTYVEDVARFNYLVSQLDTSGNIYNVCCNKETSLNDLLKIMEFDDVFYEDERFGDIKKSYGDNSKLLKDTGSQFEYSIEMGLKKYLEYENKKRLSWIYWDRHTRSTRWKIFQLEL